MSNQIDTANLKVSVTNDKGEKVLESWNDGGKQSDGSIWNLPRDLTSPDHEHNFVIIKPGSREAVCSCGRGGMIFPHNADIKNGHVYNKDNQQII